MMKGKTSLSVENSDCVEEALKECFPKAEILKNEIAQIRTRPRCDFVIRNKRNNRAYDIGLKANKDGTYEVLSYNGGYGTAAQDKKRVNAIMSPVYTKYVHNVVKKALKKNPQLTGMNLSDVMDTEILIDNKKTKVKHIRLTGGTTGGKAGKNKSSTSGGWI